MAPKSLSMLCNASEERFGGSSDMRGGHCRDVRGRWAHADAARKSASLPLSLPPSFLLTPPTLLPHELPWLQQLSQQTDQQQADRRQRSTTHLVCNFDKEAESLGGLEEQPSSNVLAEVLGLSAGLHLEGLGGRRGRHLALVDPLAVSPTKLSPLPCPLSRGLPVDPELGTVFKKRKRQLLSGSSQIVSCPALQTGLGLGLQGPGPGCTSMSDGRGQGSTDSTGDWKERDWRKRKQIPEKGRRKERGEAVQPGVGGISKSGDVRMEGGVQLRGVGSGGTCSMELSTRGDRKGS